MPTSNEEQINLLSVGIDIGSSTSHLLFSELLLERQGQRLSSRYVLRDSTIIHIAPITLTPYATPTRIDVDELSRFIAMAYRDAGLSPEDVQTGAVITTGIAATKENAPHIAALFAGDAGRFVCASAGPHLESRLAAHGSGAVELSKDERHATVLNVDIGGGTTKLAVCHQGHIEETAALHAGARLIWWNGRGESLRVEDAARRHAATVGVDLSQGVVPEPASLDRLAGGIADVITGVIRGQPPVDGDPLWASDGLDQRGPFPAVVFSGGVAEYIYGHERREFGDLGPRLARALRQRCRNLELLLPKERIRATCIGASQRTIQVSGNTIFISDPEILPIRNLPVALARRFGPSAQEVAGAVRQALVARDLNQESGGFALALQWDHGWTHSSLRELSAGIVEAVGDRLRHRSSPLVVVIDADVAGLVGHILRDELMVRAPIVCVDQVTLDEFDFLDIGAPLPDRNVVPVVIKSLLFG